MDNDLEAVFMSYSHDSETHKGQVRNLADQLRINYGIEITGDFYEEDLPAGGQIPDLMEKIRSSKKVLCVLTPNYKTKADEGRGGVGYEKTIMTDELYHEIGSAKCIPICINKELNYADIAPNFLTSTRKAILREAFNSDEEFIEAIARAILHIPKNPKPPLGKNKLLKEHPIKINSEDILIEKIIDPSNHEVLYKNALFYAKSNDEVNFRQLSKKVKKQVFINLLALREKHKLFLNFHDSNALRKIMDEFIYAASPLFLIAFAGYLSFNDRFHNQEGILIDLLTMDEWNNSVGQVEIYNIPKMLAYVYHHIYGALHVDNERINHLSKIFEQRIPDENSKNKYQLLYKVRSVTGWIDSLGRDCFKSFEYILSAYQRWDWVKLLFSDEIDFQRALVCYQASLNLLNYFMNVKDDSLTVEYQYFTSCDIPPSSMIADSKLKKYANHYLIKNKDFFKDFLKKHEIPVQTVIEKWNEWLREISKFNTFSSHFSWLFEEGLIANLL